MVDAVCIHSYESKDPMVHNLKVIPLDDDWCRAKLNGIEAFAPIAYLKIEPYP